MGIKETTRDLEELKETFSFYQEDLTYEEGRMVELLEKQNQLPPTICKRFKHQIKHQLTNAYNNNKKPNGPTICSHYSP